MPIPDFQSIMLPLLCLANDEEIWTLGDARKSLAAVFELSNEELGELLPSGRQRRFDNRVAWAKVYLEQAGLLVSPKRGRYQITPEGMAFLATNPNKITIAALNQFEKFRTFRLSAKTNKNGQEVIFSPEPTETPEELLEQSYQRINEELAGSLLEQVKQCSPTFFENLVVELLLKMGYGRNRVEAGKAIGRSGDEGIDGIISEDRLGLEAIYIQAKRWTGCVGRPEIQKFVGALHGKRARKGVFITTSTFSSDARDYVSHIDPRVVLIDGAQLSEYMIEHNLGVSVKAIYEVKRIDTDFFIEE
ncbi:restriction system protein [Nitrosomonas ureae]|uniref:restriction endonuclease n=1 Tax=Nitrosomonas ureae TaxID=44577 RepID=UPI000D75782B|nr:restriction endonuclease [Nitrosomonas ureae]PXX12645.1 restriction system protein [Nitrosomonas ureae]